MNKSGVCNPRPYPLKKVNSWTRLHEERFLPINLQLFEENVKTMKLDHYTTYALSQYSESNSTCRIILKNRPKLNITLKEENCLCLVCFIIWCSLFPAFAAEEQNPEGISSVPKILNNVDLPNPGGPMIVTNSLLVTSSRCLLMRWFQSHPLWKSSRSFTYHVFLIYPP
jgi:hypothetical protein